MIVLFPDPLGPTKAKDLPEHTEKLRFSKTIVGRDGYEKQTSQNSMFPLTIGNKIPSFELSDRLESQSIILNIFATAA